MAEQSKETAPDGRGKRSRREILAGAAGALGVIAAQTVGRAAPAQAGVDGDVVLGVDNQATSGITGVSTTGSWGLHGKSSYMGVGGGVYGEGGTYGLYGVGSTGVHGEGSTYGVGGSGGTYGVYGYGHPYGVYGIGETGVYGVGYGGNGVFGQSADSTTSGVYGQHDGTAWGVRGTAPNGIGVFAESSGSIALLVEGKAVFSRSGKATVKAGNSQVVAQNVALTSGSLVLATLQQVQAEVYVAGVVPSVANSRFTIRLNQAPTVNLKVAWFVVN